MSNALIRQLCSLFTPRIRRSSVRRHRVSANQHERLESRCLLAGNVSVSLSAAAVVVTGDELANDLEMVSSPDTLTLRGRNGTTINGAATAITLSSTGTTLNRQLLVRLGAGNDVLSIGSDIRFGRLVQIQTDAGDDSVSLVGSTLDRPFLYNAGTGTDSVVLSRQTLSSDVSITASGTLQLAVADSTFGRSLTVNTAAGNDAIVLTGSTVNGAAVLLTGAGDDNIALRNSTLKDTLYVDAGRGRDVVLLDGTKISGRTSLWMRQGDDSILLQGNTVLSRRLIVGALLGSDQLEIAGTSSAGRIRRYGRPGSTVETSQKDRMTAATTGALAKAAAAVSQAAPQLTATLNPASISETAGSSQLTVTRTGSTALPLSVQLSADNSTRITLPTSLTIPAGSLSASVNVAAVGNSVIDGNASPQLTAAAPGFNSAAVTLTVTDDDNAVLNLTPAATSVAETLTDGLSVTVSRTSGDNSQPLTVALSSTSTRLTVPASVTIPAGAASTTFLAVPINDQIVNLPGAAAIAAVATGFTSGTGSVTVTDDETAALKLELSLPSVTEGASVVTALVTRNTENTAQPLTVFVAISSERVSGPATVQIPAGQTFTTFQLQAVDNSVVDGSAAVQISASAVDFAPGVVTLTVNDNDVAPATLGLSAETTSIAENSTDGLQLTVSRSAPDISQSLAVTLDADSGALTVPATATIPAGQNSVTILLETLNDDVALGNVTVNVSATATGYSSAEFGITVVDDEVPALALSSTQTGLTEGAPGNVTFTLARNTSDISAPLSVTLSSPSSRITLPASVVIPAGQKQTTFSVNDVDDQIVNSSNSAAVQATATGFAAAQSSVSITDNDAFTLTVTPAVATVNELVGQIATTVSLGKATDTSTTVNLSYTQPDLLNGPASVTIPAGQQSASIDLTVVAGSVPENTRTGIINGTIFSTGSTATASVVVQDGDAFSLTTDVSANQVEQSSGILLTRSSSFIVNGVTAPNSTLAVDSDGDGQYDDAAATADSSGIYSLTIPLTADGQNRGDHQLIIRATGAAGIADQSVSVHYATGTLIRFNTTVGSYDVLLLEKAAPLTVANFLSYQTSPDWSGLIVHRSVPQFVVQGGGFTLNDGRISSVPTNPPIQNEFLAANSNVRGTLAMAMVSGNINSGTSQWFINVDNNVFLDEGKYTVFGRVLGNGMTVVDQINDFTTYDVKGIYNNGALGEVPLTKSPPPGTQLTGTVSLQAGSTTLTGTGTAFTTELATGADIWINSVVYRVQTVVSNTQAVLTTAANAAVTGASSWKDFLPADADFIVFSSIDELLPLLP